MNIYNIITIIVVIAFIILSFWITGGQFYYSVIAISAIMLIVGVVYVAFMIKSARQNVSWAPVVGQCPDYWTFDPSGNKCIVPKSGMPNYPGAGCPLNGEDYILPFTGAKFAEKRKEWAEKCKLYWDGVTNI